MFGGFDLLRWATDENVVDPAPSNTASLPAGKNDCGGPLVLVIVFAALFLGGALTLAKGAGGLLIVAGAIVIALE